MKLYKTEIVIWTKYDPSRLELDVLAKEAVSGGAYCSKQRTTSVEDAGKDTDWDGTEFFGVSD